MGRNRRERGGENEVKLGRERDMKECEWKTDRRRTVIKKRRSRRIIGATKKKTKWGERGRAPRRKSQKRKQLVLQNFDLHRGPVGSIFKNIDLSGRYEVSVRHDWGIRLRKFKTVKKEWDNSLYVSKERK